MENIENKIILITGASSGIGAACAELLAKAGAKLILVARRIDKLETLFASLKKINPNVECYLLKLDISDREAVMHTFKTLPDKWRDIDVLINNAGVGITGAIEEIPEAEIKNNFETNFFGPLNVIKASLPQMRSQNSGLIINVTSIAGFMGLPYRGVYSASKAALGIITEAFRMELKDFNIHMTNLAPGDFATNIAAGRYHAPVLEDSPYKTQYGYSLKMIDDHVDSGSDPKEVAYQILKIITTPKPKLHYKVGVFMQKFSVVLKHVLPGRVYEKLLMNHYKL